MLKAQQEKTLVPNRQCRLSLLPRSDVSSKQQSFSVKRSHGEIPSALAPLGLIGAHAHPNLDFSKSTPHYKVFKWILEGGANPLTPSPQTSTELFHTAFFAFFSWEVIRHHCPSQAKLA